MRIIMSSIILTLALLLASCKGAASSAPAVRFSSPTGAAVDSSGNVYVADRDNHRIRKITPAGEVSTLAGSGTAGFADTGPDGETVLVQFNSPTGVDVDSSGNVYVADKDSHRIRKITPAGEVSTFSVGFFSYPTGVAVDSSGGGYVANKDGNTILSVSSGGVGSPFAGSGTAAHGDGPGIQARFRKPHGVAVYVNSEGNLVYIYVADTENHCIRRITPAGAVSTLATGFHSPHGVAVDSSGNVYVADTDSHRIMKITITQVEGQERKEVSTLAGSGAAGFADGWRFGAL